MGIRVRTIHAACVLTLGMLSACATILPPSPLAPLLLVGPEDMPLIEALAHEQSTRIERCHERNSCAQDHYSRGLIGLFQSRERALASFQQVRSLAPDSRVGISSTAWIDLLQGGGISPSIFPGHSADVSKVLEAFVWEAIERELHEGNESVRRLFHDRAIRAARLPLRGPVPKLGLQTPPNAKDSKPNSKDEQQTQAIQKQLHDREQEVEVMSSQLDALKRIDQDARARRRSIRLPSALAP